LCVFVDAASSLVSHILHPPFCGFWNSAERNGVPPEFEEIL
jgi:hypothetical protein